MIACQKVHTTYERERVLDNVNFQLAGPTITGIIGPNGAGKSTLLKSILQIVPAGGTITIDGKPAREKLKKIAYVEQKSSIDYTFPITVRECVALGLYPQLGLFHRLQKKNWQRVDKALAQVEMTDFSQRQISELSGGQFQRVLIARCLVQEADYIFLDEPFVGIDLVSEQTIMNILRQLKALGKTILIVHHDLSKLTTYFDHILLLNKTVIAFGATAAVATEEHLAKAYGANLIFKGGAAK